MKLKLVLSVACLLFFSSLNAQIMYNDEEIKKKYDQETMVLTMDGTEKNGVLSRSNYIFPSQQLEEEINKNGGTEAQKTYKAYKKTITLYWIVGIAGLAVILATGFFVLIPAASAATATVSSINSAFLLYLLVALGITIAGVFLGKKAYRQLAFSIWQYNRHVILRK
jgi:hypothetical protein